MIALVMAAVWFYVGKVIASRDEESYRSAGIAAFVALVFVPFFGLYPLLYGGCAAAGALWGRTSQVEGGEVRRYQAGAVLAVLAALTGSVLLGL